MSDMLPGFPPETRPAKSRRQHLRDFLLVLGLAAAVAGYLALAVWSPVAAGIAAGVVIVPLLLWALWEGTA